MNLDDQRISRVVFYPRSEERGYIPRGIATTTASGTAQICGYLHPNPTARVLMLFFHGNGEIAADYDDLAEFYVGCGVSFWVLDYRGYGRSTGESSYSRMAEDAEAVLADVAAAAEQAGIDPERIVVMGRSLGSAAAIHLASAHPERLQGLVLDSPFAHGPELIRRIGGPQLTESDLTGFVDNIDRMGRCRLPTLIIHGTEDVIIPVSDARELYEVCTSRFKELIEIEGAGHNDLLMRGFDRYFAAVRSHVERITGI